MMRSLSIVLLALTTSILGADPVSAEIATDGGSAVVLPQTVGDAPVTGHDALVTGVAVGPTSVVAVGQRVCADTGTARPRCWGQAWTSPDGITWQSVEATSSGLEVGRYRPVLSGPEIGLDWVAYPAGRGGAHLTDRMFPAHGGAPVITRRMSLETTTSKGGSAWTGG